MFASFRRLPSFAPSGAFLALFIATTLPVQAQYGPILSGAGPVNRSMGGVATANPLSPSSALYWNPATITGFERSEIDFGVELLLLDTYLSSQYPANSLGVGIPPVGLSGRTKSNSSVYPLPNVGLVYRLDDTRFALGLGLSAVAGFGVDYAGSTTNPILTAGPPNGVGVGPVFSDYQVLQVSPALAYQITDRLTVAAGPNIDIARLQFAPGLFVPPDDANGDSFASYPAANQTRSAWGAGFTLGLYYRADSWASGVSYKSTQWFEPFQYNLTNELGLPRSASVNLEVPMILSFGFAYTGIERWVLATDLRYLGFGQARGFGRNGFRADGAASGLGFEDTFALAVGAQYRATDRLSVRGGYTYGSPPIPDAQASLNVASPTIIQHQLTMGGSWDVTDSFTVSLGYTHGFSGSLSGPLQTALGTVPGTTVRSESGFDSVIFGASVKFGPSCSRKCVTETP